MTAGDIAAAVGGAEVVGDASREIEGIGPLDTAGPRQLSFIDNPRYLAQLAETRAGTIVCGAKTRDRVPPSAVAIVARDPYRAFAKAATLLYPDAAFPTPLSGVPGIAATATIHPDAVLEDGVTVEAGAVIGPGATIGSGCVIGPNAVIGPNVQVGRNTAVGAGVTIQCALIGNRVIIHPGVRIGQDGFGFAMGAGGHLKVPQIGRVIVQDDVEIGANTTIDRGANRDTIVGEGTKIDNQVQIGHNVTIGRHCVIVAQVGISGSTVLDDYVALGGKVGLSGHVRIGMGAQVAGSSNVDRDIPAGERWVGTPAQPVREWTRQRMALEDLGRARAKAASEGKGER